MGTWHLDPSVIAGILVPALAYGLGVMRPRLCTRGQAVSFLLGFAALFLALESPLDTLGDTYLMSAHMTQHLVLVLIVPPLLLYGTPGWVLQPLIAWAPLRGLGYVLTRAPVAFTLYNVVFALAHLPQVFDLTLQYEGLHIAEHLLFIATGILAWWPLLGPLRALPRISYPFQMLYLFLQTLPCSLVGALITLSTVVLYTPYTLAPRVWSITALGDQQIGGLIMWIGGSTFYFLVFMAVFFLWARHEETPDYVKDGYSAPLAKGS